MTRATRKKNTRRYGKTTHGYGSRKKHRGAGNRGGRGMAGTGKRADQKKTWILKHYGLEYFGRHKFVVPPEARNVVKAINIRDLPHQDQIDLTALGYDKLLAKGNPTRKYTLRVKACSVRAKEKIEKAGGSVEVIA